MLLKEELKFRNKNILVIGGAPSAIKEKYDKKTLAKCFIVRFNLYETKGYEESIGDKTDLWIYNGNTATHNDMIDNPNRQAKNMMMISSPRQIHAKHGHKEIKRIYSKSKHHWIIQKRPWHDIFPVVDSSTGLLALLNLAEAFPEKKIYTLGYSYINPDEKDDDMQNENYMGTECLVCNHRRDAEESRSKLLMTEYNVKHFSEIDNG